ncbi:unnamed protein product [Aspergillus oryzae]|nr:unnamed protein product [Aspergillus oryzae]
MGFKMSEACVKNPEFGLRLVNTCLGEGLPRLKAAAVPPEDNTSQPHRELIGRYVSCGVMRRSTLEAVCGIPGLVRVASFPSQLILKLPRDTRQATIFSTSHSSPSFFSNYRANAVLSVGTPRRGGVNTENRSEGGKPPGLPEEQ